MRMGGCIDETLVTPTYNHVTESILVFAKTTNIQKFPHMLQSIPKIQNYNNVKGTPNRVATTWHGHADKQNSDTARHGTY